MKSFAEVTKALSICGRHPDCCKGCPYENVSYPTEIGNTCRDVMHYDALYYMQDREEIGGTEKKPKVDMICGKPFCPHCGSELELDEETKK